jgi:hypothetical protein
MRKRGHESIIRFRRYHQEKESEEFYRAKLMLFLPWRNEDTDLIKHFETHHLHYRHVRDELRDEEEKYTQNAEIIEDVILDNAVNGPPEHAWAEVAPNNEHEREQDLIEGNVPETSIENDDLIANAALTFNTTPEQPSDFVARFEAQVNSEIIPLEEFRQMMRNLNNEQRQIVNFHRKWCKRSISDLKENKPITPYRIFMSGAGGVGKSHVI